MRFHRTWKDGTSLTLSAGMLVLRCDYDPEFIEALKEAVPPRDRKWVDADQAWVIHERHERVVRRLLGEHLNEYVVVTKE